MKTCFKLAAAVAAILALAGPVTATTVTVTVPGTANPYLAGMPDGTPASSGDTAPANSPVLVTGLDLSGNATLTFAATGQVSLGTGLGPDPDGGAPATHVGSPTNGISPSTMPRVSLLGVFLDDMLPTLSPTPAGLDFSTVADQNYTALSPLLKQIFFIGDGVTDGGTVQEIVAPSSATRLYLGTMDGFGWFNNSGAFNVEVTGPHSGAAVIPLPAGAPLLLAGLAALGLMRRRAR